MGARGWRARWAPAGGGVWNSPTIDAQRRVLYIGTGDAYTEPAAKTTDSIMAIDLSTGKIVSAMIASVLLK